MTPSIDEIVALYDNYGSEHYDEAISQLAHAEQTAALAARDGATDALVAAALLHDVGHLLFLSTGEGGPHEDTGVAYLSTLFDRDVLDPIALHVDAKRCLCAIEPDYHASLSEGSKKSLVRQGGPMTSDEAAVFLEKAGGHDAVRLRRWDDLGKVDGLAVLPLRDYVPLLISLAH